jgi:hypothetical protein
VAEEERLAGVVRDKMSELSVTYVSDDEWMGKITVRVQTADFAGEGAAWINPTDIEDFAKSLEAYPLSADKPLQLEAGHGGTADGRLPPQTLVRITVKPRGTRGEILVCAELESEIWVNPDFDLHQSVVARFLTGYNEMERFAKTLQRVASPEFKGATLMGNETN